MKPAIPFILMLFGGCMTVLKEFKRGPQDVHVVNTEADRVPVSQVH